MNKKKKKNIRTKVSCTITVVVYRVQLVLVVRAVQNFQSMKTQSGGNIGGGYNSVGFQNKHKHTLSLKKNIFRESVFF